ncbi:uncharacterized protein LOC128683950 [Plodia interpunctella]|uniref:uncharacterized protein LOC128683950 n=1 Tax=Plodia interpunctella TaxID=58824 RepID=UPI002367C94D|nr:uncharacterized protein LOC128683950 [Plodia interpunctella]
MEVNIHNSFPLVLRLSWNGLVERIPSKKIIEKQMTALVLILLQNPLFTSIVTSILLMIIFVILSYSLIVLIGVFCFMSIILMTEGCLFMIFIFSFCVSIIIILCLTIIFSYYFL